MVGTPDLGLPRLQVEAPGRAILPDVGKSLEQVLPVPHQCSFVQEPGIGLQTWNLSLDASDNWMEVQGETKDRQGQGSS